MHMHNIYILRHILTHGGSLMKKKTILVSFLAVFMLLAVSFATADAYTVRPALNNNVDVGEQMVAEEAEQIIVSTIKSTSLSFLGEATLDIYVEVRDHNDGHGYPYPLSGGRVTAVPILCPLWLRYLYNVTGTTDSKGKCQLQVLALPEWLGIPVFIGFGHLTMILVSGVLDLQLFMLGGKLE